MTQTPTGRRRWPLVVAAVAALVVVASGSAVAGILTARHDSTSARPAAVTSSAAVSPSAVDGDPHGREACQLLKAAQGGDRLMDTSFVADFQAAASQARSDAIRFAGVMMGDRQKLAAAARGQGDELKMLLGYQTYALEVQADCTKNGLS